MAKNEPPPLQTAEAARAERPLVLALASDELFGMLFPAHALQRLARLACIERFAAADDSPELRRRIAVADALITTWHSPYLRAETLARSRVRLIVHCGGELAPRMEHAVVERVRVVTTAEPMAWPVAEMAVAMTLALVRGLPRYERVMRAGAGPDNRTATVGETLAGRRVGIVGLGRVGRAVAKLLAPFRAERVAYDPRASTRSARALGVRLCELDELLHSSSVVVLAASLSDESRHLIDARRLALLQEGACLVNVARGGLVDLASLTAELRSGRIAAALDVTDPLEPLPADHELRRLPNVLLTPHVAAGGIEVRRAMGQAAVRLLERLLPRKCYAVDAPAEHLRR